MDKQYAKSVLHYKLCNYNIGIIITRKDCYLNSTSSFS